MEKRVMAAGHSCLDITPMFPQTGRTAEPGALLAPGRLYRMDGADIHAGGAVSNTGIAMKLMGADVSLLTKVGEDAFGKLLRDIYDGYGVAEGILSEREGRTSYSVVLAMPGIDRIFLHDPGCNDTFSFADIEKTDFRDVGLFHFGYPPLMKKMYENDGKELIRMMRYVKSKGIVTSLDLAAVDEASEAGRADWESILRGVLPYVDIFVPSIEELCFMLDPARYREWEARAKEQGREMAAVLDPQEDIRPLAHRCTKLGAGIVMIKCGAPGLYYRTASEAELAGAADALGIDAAQWAEREGFEVSYLPERVLSATGAGDTTIAAFLTAMIKGYSFDMCIRLAAAQGASCVAAYGALGGIHTLRELEEKIKKGWAKIKSS